MPQQRFVSLLITRTVEWQFGSLDKKNWNQGERNNRPKWIIFKYFFKMEKKLLYNLMVEKIFEWFSNQTSNNFLLKEL